MATILVALDCHISVMMYLLFMTGKSILNKQEFLTIRLFIFLLLEGGQRVRNVFIFSSTKFFIEIHILQKMCYQNPGVSKIETGGN